MPSPNRTIRLKADVRKALPFWLARQMSKRGHGPTFEELLALPSTIEQILHSLTPEQLVIAAKVARAENIRRNGRVPKITNEEGELFWTVWMRECQGEKERPACECEGIVRGNKTTEEQDAFRMKYRRIKKRIDDTLAVVGLKLDMIHK